MKNYGEEEVLLEYWARLDALCKVTNSVDELTFERVSAVIGSLIREWRFFLVSSGYRKPTYTSADPLVSSGYRYHSIPTRVEILSMN